jgi:hypothetical protein
MGDGSDQGRSQDESATATKPDSPVSKTRPSGFFEFRTKEDIKDYRTWDDASTPLVPSRSHA